MRKTAALLTAATMLVSAFGALPANAAETYSLGDCNMDGYVDASDATSVLRYYSELSTGGSKWSDSMTALADMDGSGRVDSSDASYILGYYSAVSTGGSISPEKYMEYLTGGTADISFYTDPEIHTGNETVTIRVRDISADAYYAAKYPEGVDSCAYEVKIYKYTYAEDGSSKKELVSSETVRAISKSERTYRFMGEEYSEPCDVFTAALPQEIDVSSNSEYVVEVRGHYSIGGAEVVASVTSSAQIDMLPLIVNSAELSPHDSYPLYNIKSETPVLTATYRVTEADKQILDDFAREHFTEDMSNYDKLEYTWDWLNRNVTYASGSLYNDIVSDSWVSACFVKKKGQCLQYNGALAEMLAYMGYDVYMLEMWLNSDGTNQHFRAEVNIGGQAYSIEVGNNELYPGWKWLFRPIGSSIANVKK